MMALPGVPHPAAVVAIPVPGTGFVSQPQAVAQMQLAQAQAGCAQADAYQNYVNQVANQQNNTSDGINQMLQTLADNTSDPNLQNALLNSMNQPDPINDALDQQLQNQASAYEAACQTRLAAAQAAVAANASQQMAMTSASAVNAPEAPNDWQAGYQAGIAAASGQGAVAGQTNPAGTAQPQSPQAAVCQPASLANLPPASAPWGPWTPLGNNGLVFDVSRVNASTLTWRFFNAGPNTIASMNFNYSYVDANSGQPATLSDLLPFALAPGQSVGGWAAYTANTTGNITLSITQISCQ
jgi:hypothetical protein